MLTKAEARQRRELMWRIAVEKQKRDAEEVKRGINETVALRLLRGDDVQIGNGPASVKSPLDRLKDKERIGEREHQAGKRYGRDYMLANSANLQSCLNQLDRVDHCTGSGTVKERATWNWEHAKSEGLRGSVKLINIANAVCGREETFWAIANKDRDQASRYEETLLVALDLLVAHYGL